MTAWRACNTSVTPPDVFTALARLRIVREDRTREASETVNMGRNCSLRTAITGSFPLSFFLYFSVSYKYINLYINIIFVKANNLYLYFTVDYIHNKLKIRKNLIFFIIKNMFVSFPILRQT